MNVIMEKIRLYQTDAQRGKYLKRGLTDDPGFKFQEGACVDLWASIWVVAE